ncbi:acyltransferase family protein [Flavobacterium tyrosinilyticum]|uniref:acyltransferase family protein n=1 Tax=Flavobacterium tyrosinilyticum TaxID=1658740 RepID=UPI00202E9460|nr:acyltransferase [Flavobacterium tyrosinilyticum]MCM0668628.1 acyltransferase [Flavobacterium tyrosinilyticum]
MNVVKLQKLDYIDAIRGIAILMVLITHSAQPGGVKLPHVLSVLFSLGARGVQLFFIASSFTLFRSYMHRSSAERNPLKNFFIRRFFRIAPIYYLGIAYYLFRIVFNLPFWFGNQPHITIACIISNFFFCHGLSPYWINGLVPGGWSITVEMFFYCLFPFLFKRIQNINTAFLFLNFSLLIKLILQEFFQHAIFIPASNLWREFLFYYFPCQLPIFLLGIILYFLVEDKANLKLITYKNLGFFFILLLLQVGSNVDFLYLGHIIVSIFFMAFCFLLSRGKLNFISKPYIRYIGRISFSMYIIHFIVIAWLAKFHLLDFYDNSIINFFIRFALILIVSVFISTLTYRVIEIPFQNLAKNIILKTENYK